MNLKVREVPPSSGLASSSYHSTVVLNLHDVLGLIDGLEGIFETTTLEERGDNLDDLLLFASVDVALGDSERGSFRNWDNVGRRHRCAEV